MKKIIKSNLISIVLVVLIGSIISLLCNYNDNFKAIIYDNVYNSNLKFAKLKKVYNTYAGVLIPFEKMVDDEPVFTEKLKYKELNQYNHGIKLKLSENYGIPIISNGIVIYVGPNEETNKTVIIEDEDGVDYIYGNLDKVNVNIYDYVRKNDLLGSALNNELYLIFQKGDEYLDYKEFLIENKDI